MIQFLLPAFVAGLAGAAYLAQSRRNKGQMTPERTAVFETAINSVQEPEKLRALAKAFAQQGLQKQADALNKRADLRELPPDVKEGRKDAYRKAINSTDARAVLRMADVFESEGAVGAANSLRKYALELQATPNQQQPTPDEPAGPPLSPLSPEVAALNNLVSGPIKLS